MSYQILGRAVKNEHIVLGVLGSVFGGVFLATRGGKKEEVGSPASMIEKAKQSIPINASSKEEEQFIRKYIAEAEKEGAAHGHH
ncbi:hypothetical protein VKT23_020374 [Stygiomarasmius scandens]|uniref:Uncharacterized protein n=1 Tax=Marasmiellus scandens TaxID=2682957 RepID=A0ABR1IMK3_9AGAR